MLTKAQRRVLERMAAGDELVWHARPHWRWFLYDADEHVHGATVRSLLHHEWAALSEDGDHAAITDAGRAALTRP